MNKKIKELLLEGVKKKVFNCAACGIYFQKNGPVKIIENTKNIESTIYFDLASLTKPLCTALSILSLIKEKKISLRTSLGDIFGYINRELKDILIYNLLNHTSGFISYYKFYNELENIEYSLRKESIIQLILNNKLVYNTGKKFLYSDIGYILLGYIIEIISESSLEEYYYSNILEPLNLKSGIFFNKTYDTIISKNSFAPAEKCIWRGKVMHGEVSDENCWILGGVAGHAGLFGDIDSVLKLTIEILDVCKGRKKHPNINRADLLFFLKRHDLAIGSGWTCGFDTPTPGISSSGRYFSSDSVGHLGYTGTSFWIDKRKELIIVLLTNRVHPDRKNERIRQYRPYFHDRVIEIIGKNRFL